MLLFSICRARDQGVPATWSQEDQGYIAKWYSKYSAETCCEDEAVSSAIRKTLHAIFILLNLIAHYHNTWSELVLQIIYEILNLNKHHAYIYLVGEITMLIFNSLHFIATVLMYMNNDIPPIHLAKCNVTSEAHCIPSHNSSIYRDELTAFTAKMLVMSITIITKRKLYCSQQDGVTAANVTEFSRSSYSGTHLRLYKSGWD